MVSSQLMSTGEPRPLIFHSLNHLLQWLSHLGNLLFKILDSGRRVLVKMQLGAWVHNDDPSLPRTQTSKLAQHVPLLLQSHLLLTVKLLVCVFRIFDRFP